MTASIARGLRVRQPDSGRGGRSRLGIAVCASVLAHAWLLAAYPGGPAARAPVLPAWINARIAVAPPEAAESPALDALVEPRRLPVEDEPAVAVPGPRAAPAKRANPATGTSSLAQPPEIPRPAAAPTSVPAADTTWYTARDIDVYPRPGSPLRFAPPDGTGTAVVRLALWLRIDEQGEVVEVSAAEPGAPAGWVEAARAHLAAIRFAPARKDERAVRSRLLLSVSFADAGIREQGLGSRD